MSESNSTTSMTAIAFSGAASASIALAALAGGGQGSWPGLPQPIVQYSLNSPTVSYVATPNYLHPGASLADFQSRLGDAYLRLAAMQEPVGEEVQSIINRNLKALLLA